MLDFPRWKTISITLLLVFGVLLAIPSLLPEKTTEALPDWMPVERINLGLDLAGGSHIMLEADIDDVRKQRLDTMEKTIRTVLRGRRGEQENIAIGGLTRSGGKLSFMVRDATQVDDARSRLFDQTQGAGLTGERDWNIAIVDSTRIVMTPTEAGTRNFIDNAMEAARDIVDRRVNALGTREPTIIRQGDDRIVVQVPGLSDPQALKDLLGQTARLEFKMVDLNANPADIANGIAPVGSEIVPYPDDPRGAIAVKRQVLISGDQLVDANQGFDQQDNRPVVNIRFDAQGANTFARTTQQNVGKPFAMVLDGKVLSAPNINEPIIGGQAQISGNFTTESANALAISLRSGSLPVKLKVVEERTVKPELGQDSIDKGALAAIIATVAVLSFMIVTYGRFGVYANAALIINILLILGIMAVFNATLTLPGIAGFVLTIGAAVDANVLINERIREEVKRGRRPIDAVQVGYKEASRAIFDANITNVIAAALMFWFGSGPIKGFAVVLTIGIVTSVFTAVTVSRMFVAGWLKRARPAQLVI
ncbi:MAG: protein translocase subunit SecD [Sphingomonadales bacterium]|nr:protein translocase subunit SecD [Sphingomonadales bacterium]